MEQYYDIEQQQRMIKRLRRSEIRRVYSNQGWTLMVYSGIMNIAVIGTMMLDLLVQVLRSYFSVGTVDMDRVVDTIMENSGWGYLLMIAIGLIILLIWKKPKYVFGTIWQRNKPMKVGGFLQILTIFLSAQMIFMLFSMLWWLLQKLLGVDATTTTVELDGLSMFLYVGIGAPISEEILFRGLILRSMEPYGKKFAIFASALLFGLFHGNISQAPFAFLVGLVLGYVTLEHNIVWAMVLHMFNNLLISDATTRLAQFMPAGIMDLILFGVIGLCTVVALVTLLVQHKKIIAYLKQNRDDPNCVVAFWTAPGIIVLVSMMVMSILASIGTMFLAMIPM